MILPSQAGKFPICLRQRPGFCAAIVWIFFVAGLWAEGLQASNTGVADSAKGLMSPSATVAQVGASAVTSTIPASLLPALAPLAELTNAAVPMPAPTGIEPVKLFTNSAPANLADYFTATNGLPREGMSREELLVHLTKRLEIARYLRMTRQPHEAEPMLIELLAETSPVLIKQSALLELAVLAQDENNLTRAQQIYAQFLSKWCNDLRVPEILLRQGLLFRQIGMYNLAFTKFYGVMTSALVLKNDQFDYYVRLVFQAQIEVAETQYELGKYAEAAEFFARLLKQNSPAINQSQIIYKLARCYTALRKYAETVSEAQDFLARFPDAPEQPEIRFYLALALKELGRNNESLQQVLWLLQEQRAHTKGHPELWTYWQQRTGNLIANQLYQEGDYTKALEIYVNLVQLDASLQWQLPVLYQIGMTYERLWQPQKATDTYHAILGHEPEFGASAPPGLRTVFDMARWRINFIQWQNKAEAANRQLHATPPTNTSVTASLAGTRVPIP